MSWHWPTFIVTFIVVWPVYFLLGMLIAKLVKRYAR